MKARPLQALIPSGRVSSAAAAATALCRPSAPPCWASWAAWPGMLLPGPHNLFPALIFMQGEPPMFANVLTHAPRLRHSELPLISEARQTPFRHPKCQKNLCRSTYYTCRQSSCRASAWRAAFAYWQGTTSACPRGCGGFTEPGSVVSCLLFFSQISEALMTPTITATLRPAVTALPCNLIPAGEVRHG